MPQTIADVRLTVRDLLRDNWSVSGLPESVSDADIHTGWFDGGKGFPQVSVSNTESSPVAGGATGYNAIDGGGEGGVQTRSGTVLVTAWGGSRDEYDNRGEEQLQTDEMADEIGRIVSQNQAPGELNSLSVGARNTLVDDDATPTEHAVQFQLVYTWTKTPT
jgi:hypothetical protein